MGEYILIIYVLLLLVLLCFIHIEIEVFKIISEARVSNWQLMRYLQILVLLL